MNNGENILYGGDVGTDDEVRENCNSFGEFLLKTYRRGGDKVILVGREHLPIQFRFQLTEIVMFFRLMA